jgi:hypothetical protein
MNTAGQLRISAALPEAACRSVSAADVVVTCPRSAKDWPMYRAYIATRSDYTRYACPTCDTVLAYVEQTPNGLTYGVPHGAVICKVVNH